MPRKESLSFTELEAGQKVFFATTADKTVLSKKSKWQWNPNQMQDHTMMTDEIWEQLIPVT